MEKKWFKKVFSMFGGAMVGVTSFGGNLQTFAESATPVGTLEALEAGKEYSISSEVEFLHFRDLVNEGKVGGELKTEGGNTTDSRAIITLTTNLDLTEGGEYTHGYCDKPIYKDGKVVGWRGAKLDKEGKFTGWVEEPDPDAIDIKDTTALTETGKYVIKNQDGLKKFLELEDKNGKYPKGISVVLLGDVKNGVFVEPVKYDDGKPVGWYEAVFNEYGALEGWNETGNGGGVCTYRRFYQRIYSQV